MSSSAAIAEPGELLKNVWTSCFRADRLASSGFTAGKYTYRGPSVLPREQAAIDHDVEQFPDAGRTRRVWQLAAHLLDGRAAAAIEDFHDLAFASGEVNRCDFGHARDGLRRIISPCANIFATLHPSTPTSPEWLRATTGSVLGRLRWELI